MQLNRNHAELRLPGLVLLVALFTCAPAAVSAEMPAEGSANNSAESVAEGSAESSSRQEADENRPVVAIVPISSLEEGDYLQGLNSSLTGTLELTVRFIGKYRVKTVKGLVGEYERERLKALCDESGYDTVLFGETEMRKDDSVVIRLSAYDRGKDELSAEKSGVAESLLGTFETTDMLVASLVEEFSDVRVEYGRMRIVLRGADTGVEVFLDGEALGASVYEGLRMVAGEHRLRVRRATAAEQEAPVYFDGGIEIRAGEMNKFRIDVPLLSERENRGLESIDRRIVENWGRENGGEVFTAFGEAEKLLENSPSAGAERIREKYERWRQDYESRGSSVALRSSDEAEVDAGMDSFPGRVLETVFETRGIGETTEPQSGGEAVSEFWRRGAEKKLLPFRSIEVDGDLGDWEGVEPLAVDEEGDGIDYTSGTDIRAVYAAMDSEHIYVRFDVVNPPISDHPENSYEVGFDDNDTGLSYLVGVYSKFGSFRARIARENFMYMKTESSVREGCEVVQTDSGYEAQYPIEGYIEVFPNGEEGLPVYFGLNMAGVYRKGTSGADGWNGGSGVVDQILIPRKRFVLYRWGPGVAPGK